jgi:5-methylcytosine-specific restriction endonuclease McrA
MSLSAIPKTVRRLVFARANGRCQYCQLAQIGQAAVFHVNHIVPRSKGGSTDESNLARRIQMQVGILTASDSSEI